MNSTRGIEKDNKDSIAARMKASQTVKVAGTIVPGGGELHHQPGRGLYGADDVMIAGRGLSSAMRRELRRRLAIEATIGYMKTDGRLDRNFRKGHRKSEYFRAPS